MNTKFPLYRTGIGQDSHRFLSDESSKPCIIAGVLFEDVPGLAADSDGDVIFHSICNAITSLSGVPILATVATDLCLNSGITDSKVYLEKAMISLKTQKIVHVAISIEAQRPRIQKKIGQMKHKISEILNLEISQIGITATSGDGLTDFGCGDGIQAFCIITTIEV
ncbi:MAG: 2-C-methyl-D-erythritol 2,4-cyclodiphosphate synthase [Candidatus Anoxychlamydiales bacterium]|uniref:2-C-methyl-D-erythritol 2,4-cyclodiphosphate synthase n=1 Tax=marine sediment metagenome TaxID=412755 RepID=A0A0F9IRH3_9ZZZZ|nr:2-C-methyl-D-erythritol 2,4-cyclodiphosphate synthase [Candidatus Anoxychlamydiales bacterium]NGX41534.1 2-C-methyl-D-erythritol 2,4-cyclodiphosphate synthase [Candidatus Anoxychlamydiales bacterium]HEU64930.1 2-C-methyl-D-erythritol 2,4-cyclodiphosphate synthase [Chlamydiota bacterium]